MQNPALLKFMYLVSPALPVGAYAYSQGQEYAVDSGWLDTNDELEMWLRDVLQYSVGYLDLPLLARFYAAWQHNDRQTIQYWNDYLLASRETSELLLEDEQLGQALARLLVSLGLVDFESVLSAPATPPTYASLFAYAGQRWQIPLPELMHGFAWAWLENQVAAATKAVPLGQTHAQQLMMKVVDVIPHVVACAQQLDESDLGFSLPGLAVASAKHERQYSRLFRS